MVHEDSLFFECIEVRPKIQFKLPYTVKYAWDHILRTGIALLNGASSVFSDPNADFV